VCGFSCCNAENACIVTKQDMFDIMTLGNQLAQYFETTDVVGGNMYAYNFCIINCVLISRQ
jgi:hypothetical protein